MSGRTVWTSNTLSRFVDSHESLLPRGCCIWCWRCSPNLGHSYLSRFMTSVVKQLIWCCAHSRCAGSVMFATAPSANRTVPVSMLGSTWDHSSPRQYLAALRLREMSVGGTGSEVVADARGCCARLRWISLASYRGYEPCAIGCGGGQPMGRRSGVRNGHVDSSGFVYSLVGRSGTTSEAID
jgi:hypothetical protein